MRVQCHGCRIGFNIPDDKIPEGKVLKVLCPKCKAPIEIDEKQPGKESEEVSSYFPEPDSGVIGDDAFSEYASAVDVVDEGLKSALLCVSNVKQADRIAQVLQELDFYVVHASRPAFALGKLHHNNYDLIILEENFDSQKTASNLVLHHVQLLPMHVRRQFFLCLLSETKPTLDAMLAFRMGVNLVLNLRDLEKAKIILARSMKEYRNFYGVFSAELAGKHA